MKYLYTLVLLLIISVTTISAQEPLTDRIIIEFMKPGDPDAQARNYNLLPWPEEAEAAAYKAAEIWASYLEITEPIRVKFGWCDNITTSAFGSAIYSYQYTDGYYYPLPLINQLLGFDKNIDTADIICVFNSKLKSGWYFATDGGVGVTPDPNDPNAAYFQEDLLTTMLHEICHGLGINSTMTVMNGVGSWGGTVAGKARIYEAFLCDKHGNSLIDESHYKNESKTLATVLTSEEVYWKGMKATDNNSGDRVKIYAPAKWSTSSICHLDKKYKQTDNQLMSGGGVGGGNHQHTPGSIVLGMLQDIGWTLKSGATANERIEVESPIKVYTSGNEIIIEGAGNNDKVLVCDFSGKIRYTGYGSKRVNLPSGLYAVRVADQTYKVRL